MNNVKKSHSARPEKNLGKTHGTAGLKSSGCAAYSTLDIAKEVLKIRPGHILNAAILARKATSQVLRDKNIKLFDNETTFNMSTKERIIRRLKHTDLKADYISQVLRTNGHCLGNAVLQSEGFQQTGFFHPAAGVQAGED